MIFKNLLNLMADPVQYHSTNWKVHFLKIFRQKKNPYLRVLIYLTFGYLVLFSVNLNTYRMAGTWKSSKRALRTTVMANLWSKVWSLNKRKFSWRGLYTYKKGWIPEQACTNINKASDRAKGRYDIISEKRGYQQGYLIWLF